MPLVLSVTRLNARRAICDIVTPDRAVEGVGFPFAPFDPSTACATAPAPIRCRRFRFGTSACGDEAFTREARWFRLAGLSAYKQLRGSCGACTL